MSESVSQGKQYQLRYLGLFEEDLSQIVDYISHELDNPAAADKLITAVEEAIHKRSSCAEAPQNATENILTTVFMCKTTSSFM